ncbi:hypothetical protein WME75_46115 [Sorangium sp. So ce1014]|uniref:hypothetical protein n=1 Tax=Sorangium sp. So ce1014 TaxID=3133326 RepID=UPI003F6313BA
MPSRTPLFVISAGVVCSVGLSAPAASAAIRASLSRFKETHFVDDAEHPVFGAPVPSDRLGLPGGAGGLLLGGEDKLVRMFLLAATECLRGADTVDLARTPLLMLGPENTRPGVSEDALQRRLVACEEALGRTLHTESRISATGRPGLVDALARAHELLASRAVRSVLVASTDSLLDAEEVNDALAGERLRTSDNSDGFIPGEGAACVLVTRTGPGEEKGRSPLLTVAGLGTAEEPDRWIDGRPNVGRGLAQAMRQALRHADVAADGVDYRLSDCSGESFFFDEAAYAWGRVLRAPSPPGHVQILVASSIGEIGAAAGPLMLALALDAARKRWAPGPVSLVHLSGSGSARAALVAVAS